jgi:hypothetical protein
LDRLAPRKKVRIYIEWERFGGPPIQTWLQEIVKNQRLNTKSPQQIYKNNMKNIFYYYQTLEVEQHHTMDHIMEGILSSSLASSRGHPPIELQLAI